MEKENLNEHLLSEAIDTLEDSVTYNKKRSSRAFLVPRYLVAIFLCIVLFSMVENALLLKEINKLRAVPDACGSAFSTVHFSLVCFAILTFLLGGLSYDTPIEYHSYTQFGNVNESLANEAWDVVDTSPIVVALTDEYAIEHGLDKSVRFPWDDTRGIYHVKAFHHLHCLKNIRKAYLDLHFKREPVVSYEHFLHCLDSLRQDVVCLADDTPMPTIPKKHHIGDGQIRQCRSLDKLIAWTQEPERQSCFHMIDDYIPVRHTLEEFDACPKDSPHYDTAKKYFEENGHQNPFGD